MSYFVSVMSLRSEYLDCNKIEVRQIVFIKYHISKHYYLKRIFNFIIRKINNDIKSTFAWSSVH